MNKHTNNTISSTYIQTPLGTMIAHSDDHTLHTLQFIDSYSSNSSLNFKIQETVPLTLLKKQLEQYFNGTVTQFNIPLQFHGTPFQVSVWKTLQSIPFGTTYSYAQLANIIGNPSAHRAVANANAANKFAIIIPCHRIIKTDNTLGGYNGGTERKQWLLQHEKTIKTCNSIQ